jgi:hypothetical protein
MNSSDQPKSLRGWYVVVETKDKIQWGRGLGNLILSNFQLKP